MKAAPEREGRNPSTGANMKIAAAIKLMFAPAKASMRAPIDDTVQWDGGAAGAVAAC